MKRFFKGIAKWLGGIVGSVISFILIIVLLPYAASLAERYLPDISGGRIADSIVLSERLQGSARLETTMAEQTGVITHEVNDILGRTVTTTTSTMSTRPASASTCGMWISAFPAARSTFSSPPSSA